MLITNAFFQQFFDFDAAVTHHSIQWKSRPWSTGLDLYAQLVDVSLQVGRPDLQEKGMSLLKKSKSTYTYFFMSDIPFFSITMVRSIWWWSKTFGWANHDKRQFQNHYMESSFLTILCVKYIVFSFVNVTFIEYLHKVQDMSRSCPFSLIQKPGANLKFGLLLLPIR